MVKPGVPEFPKSTFGRTTGPCGAPPRSWSTTATEADAALEDHFPPGSTGRAVYRASARPRSDRCRGVDVGLWVQLSEKDWP